MTQVAAFLLGVVWGLALVICLTWAKHRWQRHRWNCPACPFRVEGFDQGMVDYVILEHSATHEP